MIRPILPIILLVLLLGFSCSSRQESDTSQKPDTLKPSSPNRMQAFVGTYTRNEGHVDGQAKGIYQLSADTSTGELFRIGTTSGIVNPSFVAFSPAGNYLYAVSEVSEGDNASGYLYAYAVNKTELTPLNRQPSHGGAPCHVAVHPSGKFVLLANYHGGIAMYPVLADGSLAEASHIQYLEGSGPNPRQKGSHPHSVTLDQEGRFAFVADLGTDKIMIFSINLEMGSLEPAATPFAQLAPGAGPRHLTFHPNGQLLYAINELNSTITAFRYDRADGHLTALQTTSTLPMGFTGNNSCADIHIEPGGRFLYGSNRGHNSIAMFSIDAGNGFLEPIGYESTRGEIPRNFAIDPYGKFLYVANQNSGNIVQFKIDRSSGRLEFVDELHISTPVCILFAPLRRPS